MTLKNIYFSDFLITRDSGKKDLNTGTTEESKPYWIRTCICNSTCICICM